MSLLIDSKIPADFCSVSKHFPLTSGCNPLSLICHSSPSFAIPRYSLGFYQNISPSPFVPPFSSHFMSRLLFLASFCHSVCFQTWPLILIEYVIIFLKRVDKNIDIPFSLNRHASNASYFTHKTFFFSLRIMSTTII